MTCSIMNSENKKIAELHDLVSNMNDNNVLLNSTISLAEISEVTKTLKNNKSVGFDNIPNEILKNENVKIALCNYLNACFKFSKVPSVWLKSVIIPIPKGGNKDPCIPLNYRGISLLCTSAKLFTAILNNRITAFSDQHNILVDEENGFRKGRSCSDHIFTLSSVIRHYLGNNQSLFCTFIDLEIAFDWIDRDLLFSN